jgi:hypothetical protein
MKAILPQIADFLSQKPIWFVVTAWLLLVPTICAHFIFEVGAIRFRGPHHEWASYDRALGYLLYYSFWIALLAAIASTIALGQRRRALAAASVVAVWLGLTAGGASWLALVPKGPQHFVRYAGQQKFFVPWQYDPGGSESPSRGGFYVFLCFDSLLGKFEKTCHRAAQLTILPAETGFDSWEERTWQFRKGEMKPAGVRGGYQAYIDSIPAQGGRPELTTSYFRRINSQGQLRCLLICKSGSCQRQMLVGHFILDYVTDDLVLDSGFSERDELDQKLMALVSSWAVP